MARFKLRKKQGTLFVILYTKLLFLLPLTILIFFHTAFYPLWMAWANYATPFYTTTALEVGQKSLAKSIFNKDVLDSISLSDSERLHAYDVVGLVRLIIALTIIALLFILALSDKKRIFLSPLFRTSVSLFYGIALLFIFIMFIGFYETLFLKFHTIIFTNDFWLLPQESLLLNIYPPKYFQHMLSILLTLSFIFYIVSIIISYSSYKAYEEKY